MTNKEKQQLLITVLCELLPYGVKYKDAHGYIETVDIWHRGLWTALNTIIYDEKPSLYLRPMSSMTREEKKELLTLLVGKDAIGYFQVENDGITNTDENTQFGHNWQYHWLNFSNENISLYVDWLNAHHFDYRGLIPMGLALPASEDMYK